MYVSATLAQPAAALAPARIVASESSLASPPIGKSVSPTLNVGRAVLNVLDGHPATVIGTVRPGMSERVVTLQTLRSHGWITLAHARTGVQGRFQLRYVPRWTGSERVRLRLSGDAHDLGGQRRLGRLNVYRVAAVSWYSGGGGLACGGSLTNATMGVANKTLPCGALVTLRYRGRTVRVPVVDRGPYVAGREFDLTLATKEALGFGDTGEVWSTR